MKQRSQFNKFFDRPITLLCNGLDGLVTRGNRLWSIVRKSIRVLVSVGVRGAGIVIVLISFHRIPHTGHPLDYEGIEWFQWVVGHAVLLGYLACGLVIATWLFFFWDELTRVSVSRGDLVSARGRAELRILVMTGRWILDGFLWGVVFVALYSTYLYRGDEYYIFPPFLFGVCAFLLTLFLRGLWGKDVVYSENKKLYSSEACLKYRTELRLHRRRVIGLYFALSPLLFLFYVSLVCPYWPASDSLWSGSTKHFLMQSDGYYASWFYVAQHFISVHIGNLFKWVFITDLVYLLVVLPPFWVCFNLLLEVFVSALTIRFQRYELLRYGKVFSYNKAEGVGEVVSGTLREGIPVMPKLTWMALFKL